MQQKKILIVDDDKDLVETYSELISNLGYHTLMAFDGEEAITRFSQEKPSLVLMDVRMPKLDGYEAFFKIKYIDPKAKVILITGNEVDDEKYVQAKKISLILLVTKPISMNFLNELITRYS